MNQQRKAIYALRRQVLEGRYSPGVSTEDAKSNKTVPVPAESGRHTVDSLSGMVRSTLAKMLDALTQAPPEALATGPDGAPVPSNESPAPTPLDPDRFRGTIYRQFGAYLDVAGITEDRAGALDRLAREVASSMIQQRERVLDLAEEVLSGVLDEHCGPQQHAEDWDLDAMATSLKERFGFDATVNDKIIDRTMLAEALWADVEKIIEAREAEFSLPLFLYFARYFWLEEIDQRWIDHLKSMEALREGIGLRGYGQKDPKQEYKKEGYMVFGMMMGSIGRNVCEKLFHMQLRRDEQGSAQAQVTLPAVPDTTRKPPRKTVETGGGAPAEAAAAGEAEDAKPMRRAEPKVGRNDPCPCGSGKKYKKCHGSVESSSAT